MTKIEFEILKFCEYNFLSLFELTRIISRIIINNKETMLSNNEKLS